MGRVSLIAAIGLVLLALAACTAPGPSLAALVALFAGSGHTCALDEEGAAWCWGMNNEGQLGDGTSTNRSVRTKVLGDLSFTTLTSGGEHTCGLDTLGLAWCWGWNEFGQLGDGTTEASTEPVPVSSGEFSAISAGYGHTCALDLAGGAHCWGANYGGQLGDGTDGARSLPNPVSGVMTYLAISSGVDHTCALEATSGGFAWCWGNGDDGQLGDGLAADSLVPVAVAAGAFTAIETGIAHTCALGKNTGGQGWCWGFNDFGQLGVGDWDARLVPTQVLAGTFFAISSRGMHACGLGKSSGGRAWCWGFGLDGQIGDGIDLDSNEPLAVNGDRLFTDISSGYDHSCALNAGGVWCWGDNLYGQLGDGTTTKRNEPVPLAPPQ